MQVVLTKLDTDTVVASIKALRAATGLGLREAKYAVDDVRAGHPKNVELLSHEDVPKLQAEGFTVELGHAKNAVVHALRKMPTYLTIGDVLAVLEAVED